MKLAQLLGPEEILLDLKADEHWPSIVELVEQLVAGGKLPAEQKADILTSLKAREDLVSTGIGTGVAIPHTFSDELEEVIAIFGRSKKGIDFQALDQGPVHLIVLFIVPRKDYHLHLRTLAAIAKMFTNSDVRRQLLAAENAEEVTAILDSRPSRTSLPGA
jgi:mannitol/fructose-specific phosphotransferase system IIA component (Ntr-type)